MKRSKHYYDRQAAEWIGSIEKCPFESLQALSNLAKTPEAFGEPKTWSTLEVKTTKQQKKQFKQLRNKV